MDELWAWQEGSPLCGDVPWQQFVDAINRMIDNAAKHVAQISARFDVVQFAGRNERIHRRRAITAAVRPSEEEIAATDGQFPFILPISGKNLKSTIVGIRCIVVASRFEMLSNAAEVGSSMSTRATVRLWSLPARGLVPHRSGLAGRIYATDAGASGHCRVVQRLNTRVSNTPSQASKNSPYSDHIHVTDGKPPGT